jgi:hypothetical protein
VSAGNNLIFGCAIVVIGIQAGNREAENTQAPSLVIKLKLAHLNLNLNT